MSGTNAIEASDVQVHEIDLDAKHLIVLTFPQETPPARARDVIENMRELLDGWWTNREPYLVIGLLDGLEIQFEKKEPEGED